MTTLMTKAINAGFAATGMFSVYVLVSLTNRKPSIMEVAFALGINESACTSSSYGVTIDTRKVSK
jgi:hypothetical protein